MRFQVPHPIPYQGSKRQLAPTILSFVPDGKFDRLIEPFAGSAAITLAASGKNLFSDFVIADTLSPLAGIWQQIVFRPDAIIARYAKIWRSQLLNPRKKFDEIRDEFNHDHEPAKLLFLIARCVKNSIRFNPSGQFNQSPDNRRLGMRPETMEREIRAAHLLLAEKCKVRCGDFIDTLKTATRRDLIYMDPPYQGTSYSKDRRYVKGVEREAIVATLEELNRRGIQYLLSYDGSCGAKRYGEPLPSSLAHRVLLDAGRSSQATLNGKNLKTLESLYVSPGLCEGRHVPVTISRSRRSSEAALFQ